MDLSKRQKNFIENDLICRVLKENEIIEKVEIEAPAHLNGFMSQIINVNFKTRNSINGDIKEYKTIVKVMKGDDEFRESSQAKLQSSNEVYIYTKVIPQFVQLLRKTETSIDAESWIAKPYFGECGFFKNYSDSYETILMAENISPYKTPDSRLHLDEAHLMLMTEKIAQYHACTIAMRILKDPKLFELAAGIKPFSFLKADGSVGQFNIFYKVGLARLFECIDKEPQHLTDESFKTDINNLRAKYANEPMLLMEEFVKVKSEDNFTVILHGDYNRNNVLFKYDGNIPIDVKMIDFQETRFTSVAIDLSFFMYMNTPPDMLDQVFDSVLHYYHDNLMKTLTKILKCSQNDERLQPYEYSKFIEHFTKYAMYGSMVTMHFAPWMGCSEDECAKLTKMFQEDWFAEELWNLLMTVGGEAVDHKMVTVMKHCSKMGFMKYRLQN